MAITVNKYAPHATDVCSAATTAADSANGDHPTIDEQGSLMNTMMNTQPTAEWLWIDDETERLIREIDTAPPSPDHEKVIDDLQDVLMNTLMGPFGLSAALLHDVDGGNVTTLHNFEKGVTANDADAALHAGYQKSRTENFDRTDYEASLPKERKKIFQQEERIVDKYTGRELPKDGRAHRDHVVSAHEVEQSAKGHFGQTREERVATANLDANKVWADGSLNQSKGDRDAKEWADRPNRKDPSKTNAEAYGVDREAMDKAYKEARDAVDSKQDRAVLIKNLQDLTLQGGLEAGKLALRQVLGMGLRNLLRGLVADVRQFAKHGLRDLAHLKSVLAARASATVADLKTRWGEYLQEGLAAALSGLLSSVVTFLVNSVCTTAGNVVTMVRESVVALIRALKIIVLPDAGMSPADVARAVLGIVGGAAATVVGLGAEEALRKLIEAMPLLAPFAGEIAAVLSGALVGVGSILMLLAFDHLKSQIAFRNKRLADVHRGQKVTLLQMRQTCLLMEASQDFMATSRTRLQDRMADAASEAQARRTANQAALDDYAHEVDGLAQLLKRVKS